MDTLARWERLDTSRPDGQMDLPGDGHHAPDQEDHGMDMTVQESADIGLLAYTAGNLLWSGALLWIYFRIFT